MKYNKIDSQGMMPSHRYSTDKGEISLVHPCSYTNEQYEIYCISGAHFDDVERYDTEEEAMTRIKSLLE